VLARKETTAVAAIAASWRVYQPSFSLPPRHTMSLPPREGWDAITQILYETPKDGRVAVALARRKAGIWYVALIDGTKASVERRSGELQTSIGTLRAPGVEEESFKGKTARPLDPPRLRELERFAEAARAKLGIPGVGIALIQGGKISFEKGLGVRELGKPAPVTPRTLFLIGSITKSMTSLMMAALVDRGKLAWDTPVTELYPGFALGDPEATRKLKLQHTVCACTGLPRQDLEFLFEYQGITPERRLEEMRSMKLTCSTPRSPSAPPTTRRCPSWCSGRSG
jgi:CubicO group peptidase (beta-lactamase class C family)